MERPLKILLLEDNSVDAEIIQRLLLKEKANCEVRLAMNKKSFLQAFEEFSPDVILSDNSLPRFNSVDALTITRQRSLYIPFILVTGTVSDEFAANIIKQGADDYILKDRMVRLPAAIDAALLKHESEKEKLTALQRLMRSEEKYRVLIQRITDAFIALDKNWCYTYLNKQAGELLHRNTDDLIGKNVWNEFPDAVGSATYEAFHKAMSEQHYISNIDYYAPLDLWQENHIYPSKDGLSVFIRDITEKKKLETELFERQKKEQLKITATALEAQEKERNSIGQELHDNVNQILVGTKMILSMVKNKPAEAAALVATSINNLQTAIEENRKIAHELVTPDFGAISLADQISNLTDAMLKTSGIDVYIDTTHLIEKLLDGQQKLTVYRIVQEQCTNIVKYAKAALVNIFLSTSNELFKMIISDDGKGMESNEKTKGIGLRNIKGRLSIFNGTANITTAPDKGFTLEIAIPLFF